MNGNWREECRHTKRYPWTPCENENTEFKEKRCESARTTLIAFANTFGGRIYFGVNDAGEPVGIDDHDETARSVMNFVRNGVDPDMSALVTVTPLVVDGKTIALTWIFYLGRRLKAHLGFV